MLLDCLLPGIGYFKTIYLNKMKKNFLICSCFALLISLQALAKTDTLEIASTKMNKTYKAAVTLPKSYESSQKNFPVLYLLHGGIGHFGDWLNKSPDKSLIQNLADQYNLVVVMPEGEVFSYYIDSPVDKNSQFESYIVKDVIGKIDKTYRTIASKNGRVITGLSMGGYGALYLSGKHPELFVAAGSMSGALNPDLLGWKLPKEANGNLRKAFDAIIGSYNDNPSIYEPYSVIAMADKMKTNGVSLIFDCGTDDFLIEPNRELHRRLVFNNTPHDYSERPGGHSWPLLGEFTILPCPLFFKSS